jgi:hypothetical protein
VESALEKGASHRRTNLRAPVDEISQARIWSGFRYRFSTQVGQDMGRKIARHVMQNVMQPTTTADAR